MAAQEKLKTTESAGMEFTREQLLALAKASPEALVDLVLVLQAQVRDLRQEIAEMRSF